MATGCSSKTKNRSSVLPKPRLRGWVHTVMAPLILLAGVGLMIATPTWGNRFAVGVWMLTGLELFGNSAVYHRVPWGAKVKDVLRRIDHANIAVFIAGTYTPLAVSLATGASRVILLAIIWACALLGVAFRFVWNGVPRWASTILYVVMGWTALWWLPQFWRTCGPAVVILILIGGGVYTVGAISYARQKPNPSPTWFGFHEVFHSCTAVAAICHAVAIGLAVI
ncbi:PAQR family membrane homeostasis protein TrhA [Cutibacterium acnes]|uniref:PAQR family membrane homeostasis protein TrhA n=1 Tax=Cutibacterium acnes TaxID=1747 RepID=UPI00051606A4|nr:hemolysin III family protein [Cutibacterium acnes]